MLWDSQEGAWRDQGDVSLPYKETKNHAERAEHQTQGGSESSLLPAFLFQKKKTHRISEAKQREPKHSRSCSEPTAVNLLQGVCE